VLNLAMEADVGAELNQRTCENCTKKTYEAGLTCHVKTCKHSQPCCVVTGYPVSRNSKVTCKSCGQFANTPDWNLYVAKMKTCPWCGSLQTPKF
jgi:hypothetical protein